MFDRLTDTFNGLFRKLSGQANISESNVKDALADVRTALLEADVHLEVVNTFIDEVLRESVGREVTKSLKPGQEMIGIVHDKLVELLGGSPEDSAKLAELLQGAAEAAQKGTPPKPIQLAVEPAIMKVSPGPTIVMMCGLQGSGKTTTCGKLAGYLKKRGRSVMLAAADLQRPAAVDQLQTIANQVQSEMGGGARVTFYSEPDKVAAYGKAVGVAVQVCQRALEAARKQGVDVLVLDTAGRLHVNDELMGELTQIKNLLQPHHIFLVVDAMTGQDAVNSAKAFNTRLHVDGIVLTKFDSDTRGGAALSVKQVTGAPIKFVGVGEKLDALEEFHAERVAGRILGMGDVVSLVEKAQEQVSQEEAEALQEKMAKGEMTMDDFLSQLKTLRRMGPMKQLLGLLPGVGQMMKDVHVEDKQLDKVEAMISSMTKKERATPSLINNPRRRRIATGSGTQQEEVGAMVKQFDMVSKLTKSMASMSAADRVKAVKGMGKDGLSQLPGMQGLPSIRNRGSTATPSIKDKFKKRKK
ncbi:MAG TPA: signal recognition particle protein [Phycisphaerales bacterium]|nr:signal recognition particle protein [Phycisphaerales bacterium]